VPPARFDFRFMLIGNVIGVGCDVSQNVRWSYLFYESAKESDGLSILQVSFAFLLEGHQRRCVDRRTIVSFLSEAPET
jgi:hypothetical protein